MPSSSKNQPSVPHELIFHEIDKEIVKQRRKDGFLDATSMCRAAGKRFNDYTRLAVTTAFLRELSSVTGIPVTGLIVTIQGGANPSMQGSWVHPHIAINLAQWLNAKFAVAVSRWVHDWLSEQEVATDDQSQSWKNLHERILLNNQIPVGYFSVFRATADISVGLIQGGFPANAENIVDISVGIHWSNHWVANNFAEMFGGRVHHPHTYPKWYNQALRGPVEAWIYPVLALGEFELWIHRGYLADKFPSYLTRCEKRGSLPSGAAVNLLAAMKRPEIAA